MKYSKNDEFKIIGKVDNINETKLYKNVDVIDKDGQKFNIIIPKDLKIDKSRIYEFSGSVDKKPEKDKLYFTSDKVLDITEFSDKELVYKYYSNFFEKAPVDLKKLNIDIKEEINKFKNKIIKDIVLKIYTEYEDKFITHPAGTKFHHAYIGGLLYHTHTMMEMAKKILKVYKFLDNDLLIGGVIIHDIEKVNEITGVDGEYTVEGQLLGHINMGIVKIDKVSKELGYDNTEEVLCLKHLILSHHGIPNFGSPKKPQMAEAMILWYIDTIDSKICVVGEELENTKPGEFTNPIFVADKTRMYKPKFNKVNKK